MIFTRLELENFGLFSGRHEFNLAPLRTGEERRNIVLFGGKNGSGKTTILEAVRLCLYGQRSRGARVRRRDYDAYLTSRIHRSRDPGASAEAASVALEFEHVHAGRSSAYRVERAWRSTGLGLREVVTVFRDGRELTEFDQEHWEDFVKELVPPGISQLFFFDGEKIQALAEESGYDSELSLSIKSLLGLDLAERLSADLSIYSRRLESPDGRQSSGEGSLAVYAERAREHEEQIRKLKQERAQTATRAATIKKTIQETEDRIAREGGSFARHRDQLADSRVRTEAELKRLEAVTRELCAGLLPFALAPDLCLSLKQRLDREQGTRAVETTRRFLEDRIPDVRHRIQRLVESQGLPPQQQQQLTGALEAELSEALFPQTTTEPAVHPVSEQAYQRLASLLERTFAEAVPEARRIASEYEKTLRELNRLQAALDKAPEEEVLRPLLEELGNLHASLSDVEEEGRQQDQRIDALTADLSAIRRAEERLRAEIAESDQSSERVRLIAKVQAALSDFSVRAKARKLEELRSHFRDCYEALARKDDVVRDVQINPDTYAVTFIDAVGRSLSKEELSAGEKQIYAIAMLWALARVAGRPLPFLIDTPLGRLDSDHRNNLVQRYFPYVAHQVVILSTDTEIDRPYFEHLQSHVARAYHLRYSGAEGATEVLDGYFWTGGERELTQVESPAA